jgi:hypothetical protein
LEGTVEEATIRADGESVGAGVVNFVNCSFLPILALSHLWKFAGAKSVFYEKLIVDPFGTLSDLQHDFGSVVEDRIKNAVVGSDIENMRRLAASPRSSYREDGGVLFFRHGSTGDGLTLPDSVKFILHSKPFAQLIHAAGYELEPKILPKFDLSQFDPFMGHIAFDNGVTISAEMLELFLSIPSISTRWNEPWKTESTASFYQWLNSPSEICGRDITNLMATVYASRDDLIVAYPILEGAALWDFRIWFMTQAFREYQINAEFLVEAIDQWEGIKNEI